MIRVRFEYENTDRHIYETKGKIKNIWLLAKLCSSSTKMTISLGCNGLSGTCHGGIVLTVG